MNQQKPNIVSRGFYGIASVFGLIGNAVNTVTDVYVVQVVQVTKPPAGSAFVVPETIAKKYVSIDDGKTSFVDLPSKASAFNFFQARAIAQSINETVKTHNEQGEEFTTRASLLSYHSAQLLETVNNSGE